MKVNWTFAAQEHLLDIYKYIANDSELYAQRMIDRLTRRSQQMENFQNLAALFQSMNSLTSGK